MMSRTFLQFALTGLASFLALATISCGNDTSGTGNTASGGLGAVGVGGAPGSGGSNNGNGGSNNGNGGATNAGGTVGTGGATGTGGAAAGGNATGGNAATGGGSAVGGSATGGKAATGGGSAVGGSATGGKAATGGGSAVGGSATGGAVAVGGSATGGKAATGGATSTGGATGSCSNVTPIKSSTCTVGESNCFSFFVASRARMFKLAQSFNGSTKGWGGDLRYGTGDGLKGADKICTEIAEEAMSGNCRTWKAFLSTSAVNAISRVGSGPWYDRLNRPIATNLTELAATRPGAITDSTIKNNLPNEDGTPHHNEEASCTNVNSCADNHDIMTGSDSDGKVCSSSTCAGMGGGIGGGGASITDYTCQNWTLGSSISGIIPRVGHTWPTMTGGSDDWISQLNESGCAPGYNLAQTGAGSGDGTGSVGEGGGYGAIYCLAAE